MARGSRCPLVYESDPAVDLENDEEREKECRKEDVEREKECGKEDGEREKECRKEDGERERKRV